MVGTSGCPFSLLTPHFAMSGLQNDNSTLVVIRFLRLLESFFLNFPLHFFVFQNKFVPLKCLRIVGNAEVRPMNVKAGPRQDAKGG